MNKLRKQSDTTYPIFFLMVDSTDHVTGKTGLSPTVTISKNGGSFASPAGAVSEVGNGLYKVAGNATDSNTVGELWIHATGTAADPTDTSYTIVAYDPFDAVRLGLTALPNAAAEASGGLYTRGTGAGQINQPANGQIDANTVKVSGTTQTARDLGASVLLSPGTGTGQISLSSGQVIASSVSGSVSGSVLGSVNGVTGNVTGSVGSVAGNISGNVNGNVAGSVGSVVGVVTANMTQIDGNATNGNNATLKLKSLDLRSNSSSVNSLHVQGYSESSSGNGGNAIFAVGGTAVGAGNNGGSGLWVEGGPGITGANRGFSIRSVASGAGGGSGVSLEGNYGASPIGITVDGYTSIPSLAIGISGNVSGSVGSLNTQAKADVNAEVKDVLETDTQAEPTGVPAAASSFKAKVGWIFARLRNKQKLTKASGVEVIYADDSVTPIGTSTDTDDAATFTKGKMS